MKLSIVALHAVALLASFATTAHAGFAVRIVTDGAGSGACASDMPYIQSMLGATLSTVPGAEAEKKGLRKLSREVCHELCQGFLVGTCWLAYRVCWPKRRMLFAQNALVATNTTYELPATVKEVNNLVCANAIIAIAAKMEEIAEMVTTDACGAALTDTMSYKCFYEE